MMPMRFVRNTLHPERYQGGHRRYPYFEGWYYKLIDASEEHRYAVIPGIYKGRDAASSHAFVQFMDGMTGEVTYVRYPLTEFQAEERAFEVRIGPNRFTCILRRRSETSGDRCASPVSTPGRSRCYRPGLWAGMPGCRSWNVITACSV